SRRDSSAAFSALLSAGNFFPNNVSTGLSASMAPADGARGTTKSPRVVPATAHRAATAERGKARVNRLVMKRTPFGNSSGAFSSCSQLTFEGCNVCCWRARSPDVLRALRGILRMLPELVTEKIESLPARPGCYLFRDKEGGVLYVGKAKSLRSRVRSYFLEGSSDTRAFIPALPRLIGDLETFVTNTEKEATILENSLIKEHRPRLNVKLRDDKEYLTLRLDKRSNWPRLTLVRRPAADGANYFGPFSSATAARKTLHLVEKHFQLRTCTDRELVSRKRPCIQYQIQRCPAPCVLEVDRDAYANQVTAVDLFL